VAQIRAALARDRIERRCDALTRSIGRRQGGAVQIVLVRHADAVPEGPALQDEHRHLSAEGRAQCRALGALLADAGVALGAVVTSPLVRAVQTAELVAGAIGWAGVIEASVRLAPGASVRIGAGWLEQSASLLSGGAVLAVGHEPSMSALTELLTGGAHVPSFRKAEACLVEDGAVRWRIEAT
jgi:phosphohistidine phosphatase